MNTHLRTVNQKLKRVNMTLEEYKAEAEAVATSNDLKHMEAFVKKHAITVEKAPLPYKKRLELAIIAEFMSMTSSSTLEAFGRVMTAWLEAKAKKGRRK